MKIRPVFLWEFIGYIGFKSDRNTQLVRFFGSAKREKVLWGPLVSNRFLDKIYSFSIVYENVGMGLSDKIRLKIM